MTDQTGQSEAMKFAALVAHQMQSPIGTASTILETLRGEFAGPLTEQQKDLLTRAIACCDQSLQTARRLLAMAKAMESPGGFAGRADLAAMLARSATRWQQEAAAHGLALRVESEQEALPVRVDESALAEVLDALVSNAIKYTPDNGQIRITARRAGAAACLAVADSGVGIPEKDRARVFQPFFRTPGARTSTRPGTGLGLAFVKSVADAVGGSVQAAAADLGGAEIILNLPLAPLARAAHMKGIAMKPLRVVIVGGVAAGPKTAAKIIRQRPEAEVTVVEKGKFLSYAGCGLPYYISGIVKDQKQLMSEPVGAERDPVFFQKVKNVRVMNQTEALEIDRAGRRVRVMELPGGRENWLEYDKLVLATGASPIVPNIPGVKLGNIFTLHGVSDAEGIRAALGEGKAHDVVIVGGGLIGVEVTEALAAKGCRVTIVEMRDQILRMLDWEIARLVERYMETCGVKILTGTRVTSFQGDGKVSAVVTDKCMLPADMVILGIGVRANTQLAKAAGLELGTTGAVKVSERMLTSDPDIYAAGDCVECTDLVTGQPCHVPMGSTANKQGRVAAVNICGGDDRFPGVLGTTVCKVFDYCVARTGLTEAAARSAGFDVVTVLAPAPDRAHYMPNARPLLLKLIADRKTGRLLGAQATGPGAADKRIDVAAMAIMAGMTVEQLANADLCYAPPYAPAMDNIITAANIVRNKMTGQMAGVTPMDVHTMLREKRDFVLLDVRSPREHEQVRLPGSTLIPLGSLRGRLDELPRDKEIVTFCKISLRGYEAAVILRAAGFQHVRVMDGGIDMWPYEKIT